MPSSKNYVRDYKQERKTAKRRGEVSSGSSGDNAKRKRARRKALKLGLVKPGQDWAHKKALSKGGSNKVSNGKAQSPAKNRSFPRNKDGSMKQ